MKRSFALFIGFAFLLSLAGCGNQPETAVTTTASPGTTVSAAPSETQPQTTASAAQTAKPQTSAPNREAGIPYAYSVQELWCKNGENDIYGKLYLPKSAPTPLPVVLLSHSFSLTHASMNAYCIDLAQNGYAAYCFDFCGGSTNSKSDGETTDMTVFTEVSDLEAVLRRFEVMDGIDKDNIFLLGTSQGGLVSALTAARHPSEIRGLILMYPGFSMAEQITTFFRDPGQISDLQLSAFAMSGMPVGREYVRALHGFDVYENIRGYTRDVLILHGSADPVVPLSYSQRAADTYAHAELHVIEGAGHGFNRENMSIFGEYDEEVLPLIHAYLQAHTV